ncbi:hypothetical protein AVEN_151831-1 [Araneus ventricosus]|uniref:Uncharacterized protein n=1 Tax=Araneus ventricosus TaxID=182803 RepID=A0A4Y2MS25_ARAVE|nr:hypothetical protein AVEN_151831-1 [Araneus ventricosus]
MKFFASTLTVPISEATCETWASVIDQLNKQTLRSAVGNEEDTGTNDKRTFIKINVPPFGYKKTRKCLKAGLNPMHGKNYFLHSVNIHKKKTGKFVTSKVVSTVYNEAECLPFVK